MTSRTHNAKAGKEQFGSSGDNRARQQRQAEDPQHSNARDRANGDPGGRKGGSNEKNL